MKLQHTIIICLLLVPLYLFAQESEAPKDVNLNVVIIHETKLSPIKEELQSVFGNKWKMAYAVMMSESGGNIKAVNQNTDDVKSIDRGVFQINSYWHPEVSIDCAFDMECSIREAYRISKGGTDWREWYGYLNGGYKKFL